VIQQNSDDLDWRRFQGPKKQKLTNRPSTETMCHEIEQTAIESALFILLKHGKPFLKNGQYGSPTCEAANTFINTTNRYGERMFSHLDRSIDHTSVKAGICYLEAKVIFATWQGTKEVLYMWTDRIKAQRKARILIDTSPKERDRQNAKLLNHMSIVSQAEENLRLKAATRTELQSIRDWSVQNGYLPATETKMTCDILKAVAKLHKQKLLSEGKSFGSLINYSNANKQTLIKMLRSCILPTIQSSQSTNSNNYTVSIVE
jgi:hypothetical protein